MSSTNRKRYIVDFHEGLHHFIHSGDNDIGQAYAIGRLYDKMNRLINVSRSKSEVKDESVEDTLKDLACYSLMYLAYLDKKRVAEIPDVDFE